jgi:hypothetical protein
MRLLLLPVCVDETVSVSCQDVSETVAVLPGCK